MSWASRRQFTYLSGVFGVLAIIAFIFLYPILTKPATCTDGVKNGGEAGVDCGGACSRICSSQASEPLILWSRAFHVTGSVYNLVALFENQNKNGAAMSASYEFRIYDTNNRLLGRREGTTYIPPNQQFAVFESRFDSGEAQIKSVLFEFVSPFVWIKKAPTFQTLPVTITDAVFGDDKKSPTLTAKITNDSIYDLPEFDVVSILYDEDNIAINASKTRKQGLASNASAPLLFTWPEAFSANPVTKEFLTQINPFTTPF